MNEKELTKLAEKLAETGNPIAGDIVTMIGQGVPFEDMLVNDGNDLWGEDCATTREACEALADQWRAEGQTVNDPDEDLETVEDWLQAQNIPA